MAHNPSIKPKILFVTIFPETIYRREKTNFCITVSCFVTPPPVYMLHKMVHRRVPPRYLLIENVINIIIR